MGDQPLLLDAANAAALCSVSLRTWRDWDAIGRCPAPIRFRRNLRWSRRELEAWVDAGCPDRLEWNERRRLRLAATG
jgi:predicted DNA-binding transcriptional regulator AlpA